MKISDDQNTITLDDGTVLVAEPVLLTGLAACFECYFDNSKNCHNISCGNWERVATDDVIFVQKV